MSKIIATFGSWLWFLLLSTSAAAQPLTQGLVAYWSLNSTPANSVSSSHDLVPIGGPAYVSAPLYATAASLGGSSYFSVADHADLSLTGDFTVIAWVKPASFGAANVIVSKDDVFLGREWSLLYNATFGRYRFATFGGGGAAVNTDAHGPSATGVWQMVCARKGGSTLYVNVNAGAVDSVGGAVTTDGATSVGVGTRWSNGASDSRWVGDIGPVMIWKGRALSDTEVATVFNGGAGRAFPMLAVVPASNTGALSVPGGNAANCYWLLGHSAGFDPFTIEVEFQSGHKANYSVGDYLPVGCNVFAYYVAPSASASRSMRCYAPACVKDDIGDVPRYIWITNQGGAPWVTSQSNGQGPAGLFCTASCPTCQGAPTNDPFGDDDNDGVRNECDPDVLPCLDANADGCCDFCGNNCGARPCEDPDGEGPLELIDDDEDGLCADCDPDEVSCVNEDAKSWICDHCANTENDDCEQFGAGWPECCQNDPEHEDYPECGCEPGEGVWPECCEGNPSHPLYPSCGDCNPTTETWPECCTEDSEHPLYPCCDGAGEGCPPCDCDHPDYPACCIDNPESPRYPDCAPCEDDCKGCNPCDRLNVIISMMQQQSSSVSVGNNPQISQRANPSIVKPTISHSELPTGFDTSATRPTWSVYVPIPYGGDSYWDFGGRASDWRFGGQPLLEGSMLTTVDTIRVAGRTLMSFFVLWIFAGRVFALLFKV